MSDYYSDKLSAVRLQKCYEVAPPRVQQYLRAEIDCVLDYCRPDSEVLELGCGFGRVLEPIARHAGMAVGLDTSLASLKLAAAQLRSHRNIPLVCGNAANLPFGNNTFDLVVCIQNGLSAFHVDQALLIREALRVVRPESTVLFSSYAASFWIHRLEWFEIQAALGLIGEIDREKTHGGNIVCKDGFTATTLDEPAFRKLAADLDAEARVFTVDDSSLFIELRKRSL